MRVLAALWALSVLPFRRRTTRLIVPRGIKRVRIVDPVSFGLALFLLAGCQAAPAEVPSGTIAIAEPARPACVAWDGGAALRANGFRVAEIQDVALFLRGFNALPPASDFHTERVFAVTHPQGRAGVVALVFVDGPCVVETGQVGRAQFEEIMGKGI